MNISIVTACPSGVANTIIASGLLKNAAKTLGFNANVECHSTIRQVDLLSQDVLSGSDVIVIAGHEGFDTQRFIGHKVYQQPINTVMENPQAWLKNAVEKAEVLTEENVSKPVANRNSAPLDTDAPPKI